MAEQTGFFSNGDYYNQDVFSAFIADCISTGVVQTVDSALAVTQYSTPAMSVNISLGRAYINGFYFAVVGEASTRPITAANASNPRIDRVVLGLSPTEAQSITLYVKAGTPAASPVPPTLSRTDELYEISLAQVLVPAGATQIVAANITDERYDDTVCGWARPGTQSPGTAETWGYYIDMSVSNPAAVNFTGKLFGLSQEARTQFIDDNFLKVTVCQNGSEVYHLNKNNWNQTESGGAAVIDGSAGDVFLRIAKLYTNHYMLPSPNGGRVLYCEMCNRPKDGLTCKAHMWGDEERSYYYHGIFEGTSNSAGTALMSAYSTTTTPTVSKTLDAFRAMTTESVKGSDRYGLVDYNGQTLWLDLFIMVYGTRNGQAACGNGLVGLSAASPVGSAPLITSGMTYGSTSNSTTHVKALHCVNMWGNTWEFRDGFIMFDGRVYVNPSSKGMINLYPGNVNVTEAAVQAAGYLNVVQANIAGTNGYISTVSGSDVAPFVPGVGDTINGSSATFFCDYYYQETGARIAIVGGNWSDGAHAGPFCLRLNIAPSYAWSAYGARLRMISAT